MNSFRNRIRPLVEAELAAAQSCESRGERAAAFAHLERAHVLGQPATALHVQVHWRMLRWGWAHRDGREVCGQLLRIMAAAVFTMFGWVPVGNTGGARVSALRRMDVPADLQSMLDLARKSQTGN